MWDVPSTPAFWKTCRYILSIVLTAPLGVASPEIKKYVEFPFLTFNNSFPSVAGMTLLMWAPVLRRLVCIRKTLPLCCSSSLDRHTASTRDRPDHRCNCIHAFTRALLRENKPVLGIAARTALYSVGSKGRTLLASSALTWMVE